MTIQFYEDNADSFFKDTVDVDMSGLYERFTKHLPTGSLILDAGCGSGRDAKSFLNMGYAVEAFDASSEMVKRAKAHTGLDVQLSKFEDVEALEKYDGLWTCASLLHVPANALETIFQKLADALKVNGVWYVSFKYGYEERIKGGRAFTDLNELMLSEIVTKIRNLKPLEIWLTEDKRPDRNEKWLNAILTKTP